MAKSFLLGNRVQKMPWSITSVEWRWVELEDYDLTVEEKVKARFKQGVEKYMGK